jgi:4-hydroxy-3-polyprenylbenzoate decarboxylase
MTPDAKPLVLALTGASGAPYAVRLLQVLAQSGREVHLVMSRAAAEVLRDEVDINVDPDHFDSSMFIDAVLSDTGHQASGPPPPARRDSEASALRPRPPATWLQYHHYTDWSAGIASGSFLTDGMVICPCSMSTLGAIAGGLSTNLIQRAADVHLKERRKLILVPRETPLNLIQLENMTQCVRAGAVVLPAMPGWYHRPQSLDDLVNFVVGRICDQLGVPHDLSRRWGTEATQPKLS